MKVLEVLVIIVKYVTLQCYPLMIKSVIIIVKVT